MFRNRLAALSSAFAIVALGVGAGPATAQVYQGYPAPISGGGGGYAPPAGYFRGAWTTTYVPAAPAAATRAPVAYQSAYQPAASHEPSTLTSAERNPNAARIDVRLPLSGAEIWVSGKETRQRGTLRFFVTEGLQADRQYDFPIKARWVEAGEAQERTRIIAVHAGDHLVVDFTRPAEEVKARLRAVGAKSK